jgi:uncharacterized Tic20 family protein
VNRSANIVLLLVGILLFLGSCAPFGIMFYHETLVEPVDSYSMLTGGASDTASFQLTPGTLARFAIETNIATTSVQEDPESFDDKYLARFAIPLSYTISDSSGNTLKNKNTSLDWKESFAISTSNEKSSSTGGTLTARLNLEKFTVPVDGSVTIDIGVGPDTTYEAISTSSKLHLYENLVNNTGYIIAGVAMLIVGFILSVLSFILLIVSSAQSSNADQESVSDNQKANQDAMIIQLSAFSGYLIPLGSLIVPLILWQIWRKKDNYIDEMGKEAINFEISMLIYYFISLILCFVIIGFLLLFAVAIFHFAYIIIAAIHTSRGNHFRYPLTIRLIK